MASISHLNALGARERAHALAVLDSILADDDTGGREALYAAQNDVVGKSKADFQLDVATGLASRALLVLLRRIEALENEGT